MKKLFFLLLVLIYGCQNDQPEKDKLQARIKELENQVQELQNGAERRIAKIRDDYKNHRYESLRQNIAELKKLHPGTKEAIEGEKYIISIDSIISVQEETKAKDELLRKKEAEKSVAQRIHEIIRIKYVKTEEPNSAGGVDLKIYWQNTGKKSIKYAHFSVVPFNKVNDPVECNIRGSDFTGQVTGPIKSGQWYGGNTQWSCAWYNNTIVRAVLTKIELEYMDGSKETIQGNDLNYAVY